MKKKPLLYTMVLFTLVLAACGGQAADSGDGGTGDPFDLGGREITVMVENEYPPFNTIDENGDGVGWDYDVWRAICEKLNCVAVFTEAAWPPFEMMAAGELDVAADGITVKVERALIIDYSDPYIEYGQVMLVRADSDLTSEEAVTGSDDVILGSQPGTTNEAIALSMVPEDRLRSYDSFPTAVEALLAGDIDGIAIDEVAAVDWIKNNPNELKAGFSATAGEFLAFVFPPGSSLIGPVNYAMQQLAEDGTLDNICNEWLLRPCTTLP